jgi:DNA-binding transcriptional ArsR family regulator
MPTRAERRQITANRIKALSSQLRAEVFRLIRDREGISTKEAAQELEVDIRELSYHVRKLRDLGCIEEVGSRRVRSSTETFYRATQQHTIDIEEWAELAEDEPEMAEFSVDEFMQSIFDDYTASRQAGIVGRDDKFWVVRHLLTLDSKGLREANKAAEHYESELLAIQGRSADRESEKGTETVPVSAAIVYFRLPKSFAKNPASVEMSPAVDC